MIEMKICRPLDKIAPNYLEVAQGKEKKKVAQGKKKRYLMKKNGTKTSKRLLCLCLSQHTPRAEVFFLPGRQTVKLHI